MTITDAQLTAWLTAWLWPFVRVLALISAAPVIGTRAVPARIRLICAVAVTAVIVPVLPASATVAPLSAAGAMVTIQQVLIGLVLGLSLRLIFTTVELTGQLLGQQMGLGFAAMIDPQTGNQVPVVSQIYVLLATLLFLAMNGHLLMFQALAESFHSLPVGVIGVSYDGFAVLLKWAGALFMQATVMALPTVIALLIVNIGYGVLARTAPQLNIFAVGFPMTLVAGAFLIGLALAALPQQVSQLIDHAFEAYKQILVTR